MEDNDDDFIQEAYDPETGVPTHQPLPIGQLSRKDDSALEPKAQEPLKQPVVRPSPLKVKKEEPKRVEPIAKEQVKLMPKSKPIIKQHKTPVRESKVTVVAAKKPAIIKKKVVAKRAKPAKRPQSHWDWQKIGVAGIIAGLVIAGIVFSFAFSSQKSLSLQPAVNYDGTCVSQFNLAQDAVVFVTIDDCAHCSATTAIVQGLIDEQYVFYPLSLDNEYAKNILATCFKDVIKDAVPQFICTKDGSTLVGIQSKDSLKKFADECKK